MVKKRLFLHTVNRLCFHSSHVTHNLQFHQNFNTLCRWPLRWGTLVCERRSGWQETWKEFKGRRWKPFGRPKVRCNAMKSYEKHSFMKHAGTTLWKLDGWRNQILSTWLRTKQTAAHASSLVKLYWRMDLNFIPRDVEMKNWNTLPQYSICVLHGVHPSPLLVILQFLLPVRHFPFSSTPPQLHNRPLGESFPRW